MLTRKTQTHTHVAVAVSFCQTPQLQTSQRCVVVFSLLSSLSTLSPHVVCHTSRKSLRRLASDRQGLYRSTYRSIVAAPDDGAASVARPARQRFAAFAVLCSRTAVFKCFLPLPCVHAVTGLHKLSHSVPPREGGALVSVLRLFSSRGKGEGGEMNGCGEVLARLLSVFFQKIVQALFCLPMWRMSQSRGGELE